MHSIFKTLDKGPQSRQWLWDIVIGLSESLLLDHQNADGSWPPPPDETHERQAGPVYTTALAVLSLTVEYRFLPIYQR